MKLSRQKLRQLIIETLQETKRYIGSPGGGVVPADRAYQRAEEKDMYAAAVHPKIGTIMRTGIEGRRQGRDLAGALASPDSEYAQWGELTPEEETAIDHMGFERAGEESFPEEGVEQMVDPGDLLGAMKSKSENSLTKFGFYYIEDVISDFGENNWNASEPLFIFQADVLGCDVEDLAYVSSDDVEGSLSYDSYQIIVKTLSEKKSQGMTPPGDEEGNFGYNQLYNLDGIKLLYTDHHVFSTFTICGR